MEAQDIRERLPKDVDNAIRVIEFEMRRKKQALAAIESKTEPSENERIKVGRERDFMLNVGRLIEAFKRTFHANLGQIPPCDLDLEMAILGALMLERFAIQQVQSFLLPEHFYKEGHSHIYTCILEANKQGENPNMITVKNILRKKGWLELVGGAHYLAVLTSNVSSAASVDYHSRAIVEYAMRRQMIMVCSQVLRNAYDDTNDTIELLESARDQINECFTWMRQ